MKNSEYWPFNTEIKERCILEIGENSSPQRSPALGESCQENSITSTNSQDFFLVSSRLLLAPATPEMPIPNGIGDFYYVNWGSDLDVFPPFLYLAQVLLSSVCHFLVWVLPVSFHVKLLPL